MRAPVETRTRSCCGCPLAACESQTSRSDCMHELVARIDPEIEIDAFYGDIAYADDARRVAEADFAFLATDTILSRYAFNLMCHQYLVPGIQVGAKVTSDGQTGDVALVHVMERPVALGGACLDCAGAIPADALAQEPLSHEERRAQAYVDDAPPEQLEDPSVITLNSISTSLAATDFLLMATGLLDPAVDLDARAFYPQSRELRSRAVTAKAGWRFCDPLGAHSVFARGDLKALPLRPGTLPRLPAPPQLFADVGVQARLTRLGRRITRRGCVSAARHERSSGSRTVR